MQDWWKKSTFSNASSACIEARSDAGMIELRESDEADTVVRTTPEKWAAFIAGVKAGEFDVP